MDQKQELERGEPNTIRRMYGQKHNHIILPLSFTLAVLFPIFSLRSLTDKLLENIHPKLTAISSLRCKDGFSRNQEIESF